MMYDDRRLERLEARISDLETEMTHLAGGAWSPATAVPEPQAPQAPPAPLPADPMFAATIAALSAPAAPPESREAGSFERLIAGRGLQIAGATLVLVGCAFFLDLAFTRGWVGPMERIVLGLLIGAGLIGFGTRMAKPAYRAIGESLIGLGAGISYLSLWASVQVFPDLHVPPIAAFVAMIAVTAVLAALAGTRRSQVTALFGAVGGFLTPVLLSSGSTDHVVLAGYVLVLAVAMMSLAVRYDFGRLEVVTLIGMLSYSAAFAPDPAVGWSSTAAEIVATLFFLVFAIAVGIGNVTAANEGRRVTLLATATASYAWVLETIFAAEQQTLGIALLVLSAVLLGAARQKPLNASLARTCGYFALGTITLALAALVKGATLIDALTLEAGLVYYAGRRVKEGWVSIAGLVLLAVLGLLDFADGFSFVHEDVWQFAISMGLWLATAGCLLHLERYAADREETKLGFAAARVYFDAMAVFALSRLCAEVFRDGSLGYGDGISSGGQFAISAVWTAYASALFVYGLRRKLVFFRWEALALFGCTILKVFSVDLASVELEWRVLSFIVLGGVLFAISALYTRSMAKAEASVE